MIIPVGYAHVAHFFGGNSLPNGAAITYGVGGFGENDPLTLAELLHDAFTAEWGPSLTTGTNLEATRVKFGPNSTGPFATFSEQYTGLNPDQGLPPNTAALLKKQTASGGRSGQGRMFLPGLTEAQVAGNGDWLSGYLATLQTQASDWLTAIEGITTGMFLFHTASSDPTKVTGLGVDAKVATQRRRLR